MRTYIEAHEYSKLKPTELVEFYSLRVDGITRMSGGPKQYYTGFFLNGKHAGSHVYYSGNIPQYRNIYNSKTSQSEHTRFWSDGCIMKRYFKKTKSMHGEYIEFNGDGTPKYHQFLVNDKHIKELDYLVKDPRDEAFYFTLALYGIDKEYTFN